MDTWHYGGTKFLFRKRTLKFVEVKGHHHIFLQLYFKCFRKKMSQGHTHALTHAHLHTHAHMHTHARTHTQ